MADVKISALTTDSTPDRTADYGPAYDASAVATKKVLLKDYGSYNLDAFLSLNLSPADATTYMFSPFPSIGLATSAANNKIYFRRTGIITAIDIFGICTVGSNETSTISFRYNDTTDTTITSTAIFNATPFVFSNTSLSIAVTAGSYCTIKWTAPTWVTTNPTNLNMHAQIYVS